MQRTDVLVVGAGQAGLAMSHCLSARGIAHVVLERGRVGESWRSERWDSLRLLDPELDDAGCPATAMPGRTPTASWRATRWSRCSTTMPRRSRAPVVGRAPVRALRRGRRRLSRRDRRPAAGSPAPSWWRPAPAAGRGCPASPRRCRRHRPGHARRLPAAGRPARRRRAGGGRLVDRAAARRRRSHASGRPVTLAVGRHLRMVAPLPRPRHLRLAGRWPGSPARAGGGSRTSPPPGGSRRCSSRAAGRSIWRGWPPRACGSPAGSKGIDGARLALGDDLAEDCAASDARLAPGARPDRRARSPPPGSRRRRIRRPGRARSIRRATCRQPRPRGRGHRERGLGDRLRARLSLAEAAGARRALARSRTRGGVTAAPGLYALGLRFQCRRNSNFIDGVGRDAEALADRASRATSARRWPREDA